MTAPRFARRAALALLLVMGLGVASPAAAADPAPEIAVGQVWSIKSAAPTQAKVVIGRIEPLGKDTAVHISVIDVPRPEGFPGPGPTTVIAHSPFERSALVASLDTLLSTGATPEPEFESGYAQWREASGGIFTVSVADAIELVLTTVVEAQSR